MADSLIIADRIELLGGVGGKTLGDPTCPYASIQLADPYDFSAAQPTADVVANLILDGERPYGRRASNRQPVLPLVITAPDRFSLAAARELLMQAIDSQAWTLRWTRDPGPNGTPLPMILDCFRAQATVVEYNLKRERQLLSTLTITFQALPYCRSDTPIT